MAGPASSQLRPRESRLAWPNPQHGASCGPDSNLDVLSKALVLTSLFTHGSHQIKTAEIQPHFHPLRASSNLCPLLGKNFQRLGHHLPMNCSKREWLKGAPRPHLRTISSIPAWPRALSLSLPPHTLNRWVGGCLLTSHASAQERTGSGGGGRVVPEECTGLGAPQVTLKPTYCFLWRTPMHKAQVSSTSTCPSSPGILSCSGNQGRFWGSVLCSSSCGTSTFTKHLL